MHNIYLNEAIKKLKANASKFEIVYELEEIYKKEIKQEEKRLEIISSNQKINELNESSYYLDVRESTLDDIREAIDFVKSTVLARETSVDLFKEHLSKNPYDIFFTDNKDVIIDFDTAFDLLPLSKNLTRKDKKELKKDLKFAIKENGKNWFIQLIDKSKITLDEIIEKNLNKQPITQKTKEDNERF